MKAQLPQEKGKGSLDSKKREAYRSFLAWKKKGNIVINLYESEER